jgi:hypothetical protein
MRFPEAFHPSGTSPNTGPGLGFDTCHAGRAAGKFHGSDPVHPISGTGKYAMTAAV